MPPPPKKNTTLLLTQNEMVLFKVKCVGLCVGESGGGARELQE